jgi:O-antigen/teichoic acid export membrane protein
MARVFGAEGYGALAGTVALFMTFAQFAGLGSGIALTRHLSRNGELQGKLLATQHVYGVTSVVTFIVIWPGSVLLFAWTFSPATLGCLSAAELVVAPSLLPLVYRYLAEERLSAAGALLTVAPVARLAAIGAVAVYGSSRVSTFAIAYLGFLLIAVGIAMWRLWPVHKPVRSYTLRATIREGLPFVVSNLAITAGGELDKTIMLRALGGVITGQYAAAYRIMQAATLPISSLVLAAAPRMFRAKQGSFDLFTKLMLVTLAYALAASFMLVLISPLAHFVLGDDFSKSEIILRWLCIVLVTNCLRQVITAQLTTADLQQRRNLIELCSLAVSVLLLVTLVPKIGPFGAIVALAISDGSVIIAGGFLMFRRTEAPTRNDVHDPL